MFPLKSGLLGLAMQDALIIPFESWRVGLLNLADALGSVERIEIIVARLEATAKTIEIDADDVCALALLTESAAHFDPSSLPKFEPDPRATAAAAVIDKDGQLSRHLEAIGDYIEGERDRREQAVGLVFPEGDPRRLLKDTIFGFAAAELHDTAQRTGDADPFTRISNRLSLWFRPNYDFRRYGLHLADSGLAIKRLVRKLAEAQKSEDADDLTSLVALWAGDVPVIADREGVLKIVFQDSMPRVGGLSSVLAFETMAALSKEVDKLDIETAKVLAGAIGAALRLSDVGSPATTDYRKWIISQSMAGEHLSLACDPFSLMDAIQHETHIQSFGVVIKEIANVANKKGIATFNVGPFPLSGSYLRRDSDLFDSFSAALPEIVDLWRLCSCDGDYGDAEEPFMNQALWTGEHDPDAITVADVLDNALRRKDYALCDMLIGAWLLVCCLSKRTPLPDINGLTRRINALPQEFRSSTYAAVAYLRREALEVPLLSRDVQVLLSWLPIIEVAAAVDFDTYFKHVFSVNNWGLLLEEEQGRLISAERSIHSLRREANQEGGDALLRSIVSDWSSVAETILRRVIQRLDPSKKTAITREPLGKLIEVVTPGEGGQTGLLRGQRFDIEKLISSSLAHLGQLNKLNSRRGKHIGATPITWPEVISLHLNLYAALKSLLDFANAR
jgi:hypothetical protein